jgi:O-antigen ligase
MSSTHESSPYVPMAARVVEGCWLSALLLVPLVIVPEESIVGAIQAPKIFVFRSLSTILLVSLIFSFASNLWMAEALRRPVADTARRALRNLRSHPVGLAVTAALGANLLSYLLSPVRSVSWGGVDSGFDSYGLLNILCFFTFFLALASHLRTARQLRRLLWVSMITSVAIWIYGFMQFLGVDGLLGSLRGPGRLTLTFGNPIFAAAFLLMGMPLSLVLWETLRARMGMLVHVGAGVALIMFPLFGIAYSLSRGAIVSLIFELAVYVGLGAYALGWRSMRRTLVVIGLSMMLVVLLGSLSISGNSVGQLKNRLMSISSELSTSAGLSGRYGIWEKALDGYLTVPWVDEALNPELPGIGFRPLRRLVGSGPDTFGIIYGLGGKEPHLSVLERSAHNIVIHTLVELGLLGLLAYIWTVAAVIYVLWTVIRGARERGAEADIALLAVGLTAVFMGRSLEQMVGKAQVSDLLYMWILLGVVAAVAHRGGLLSMGSRAVSAPRRGRATVAPSRQESWSMSQVRRGVLALVAISAIFAWWGGPLADIRALALSGQAKQAGEGARPELAGARYQQALGIAPHSSVPRLLLAQGLLNSAREDSVAASSLSALVRASETITGVIERNPMDLRAREWAATIQLEIAVLDGSHWPRAVREAELVVALSPGRWKQLEPLAWVLALSGNAGAALDAIHQAQALGAAESSDSYLLYYIETKIERERGNTERADAALEILRTFSHPDVTFLLEDAGG